MFIEWNHELETGNEMIDNQHKELFNRINKLYKVTSDYEKLYQKNESEKNLKATLFFLTDYVIEHFHDEEEYMKTHEYMKFKEHKEMHDDFVKVVHKELQNFNESGPSLVNIINLVKITASWLTQHILKHDLEMIKAIKYGQS